MMFCGHVHDYFLKLEDPIKILNVGCDYWNYTPVEWDIAIEFLKYAKPTKGVTLESFTEQRLLSIKERAKRRKKEKKTKRQLSLF
jgi:hypothetical protein